MQYKTGGYEAHITVDKSYATEVAKIGEQSGWVYSQITGCPILGQGTYCYLTSYSKDEPKKLRGIMQDICTSLELLKIPVLRSKIEHIVFDSKTGVNELTER